MPDYRVVLENGSVHAYYDVNLMVGNGVSWLSFTRDSEYKAVIAPGKWISYEKINLPKEQVSVPPYSPPEQQLPPTKDPHVRKIRTLLDSEEEE